MEKKVLRGDDRKMDCLYEKDLMIPVSMTDFSARLGYHDIFTLFMDLAGEQAEALGIGAAYMAKRGVFWLTVKTKIRFYERPGLNRRVKPSTWPQEPEKLHFDRSYQITQEGKTLIIGKTQWALMDIAAGRLRPVGEVYPAELTLDRAPALDAPYAHIAETFDGAEDCGSYTVRPTDIDLGGHMNNAAYVRVLLDLFPTRTLKDTPIREIDALFRAPCFEGDTLHIQRRRGEGMQEFRMSAADGKTVFLARVGF